MRGHKRRGERVNLYRPPCASAPFFVAIASGKGEMIRLVRTSPPPLPTFGERDIRRRRGGRYLHIPHHCGRRYLPLLPSSPPIGTAEVFLLRRGRGNSTPPRSFGRGHLIDLQPEVGGNYHGPPQFPPSDARRWSIPFRGGRSRIPEACRKVWAPTASPSAAFRRSPPAVRQ